MARTTANRVKKVLMKDYDEEEAPDLSPFIDTASGIVDRVEDLAASTDETLTSAQLELIERWLAAHCYCISDQPYANKATQGTSATFQGRTGMYLEATKYGQMAMSLDYSGSLMAIGSGSGRKTAGGFWLGRNPSEQTDYEDRR